MAVSYTCPTCKTKLKTANRLPPGKVVTCPACGEKFTPEPAAPEGTLKLADEDTPKKAAAPAKPGTKPAAKAEEPKKAEPAAAPVGKKPFADDDDESAESIKKGYGIVQETEAEKEEAEKNKPKFGEVADKFKKSARGPAQGLLVMPSNLLTGEGLITIIGGILLIVIGMWPLVFNDAPPGEEELDEAIIYMLLGVVTFVWGAMVCYGASHMQELGSYPIAMVGAIMGIVPLLVGIYGVVMLQNPKVRAGFEETEGEAGDEEEGEKGDEDGDDEEDDDGDDDDDGGGSGAAKKLAKKAAKKVGRKLLKGLLGGGGDDD